MKLSIFDGSEDAYWWIICSEKSFNSRNRIVSDAEKLMECALAMRGSALTWWLSWNLINPKRNWDSFTCALLWHFKPEWRPILPIEGEEKIEQTEDKEPAVTTILPETQSKNEMPEETQQEKTEFITSVEQSICIISTVGEKICSLPRSQPPQLLTSSFSSVASSSKPPDPPPGIVLTQSLPSTPPLPPEPPDLKSVSDEVLALQTPPPLKDKVLPPLKPPLPSSKPPPLLKSPDKTILPPPSPPLLPSQTLPPAQTPSPLKPPPPKPPDEILTPPVPPPPPKLPDIQLPFSVAHLQYYTHSEIFVVEELFDFLSLKDAHQTQSPPLDPSIVALEKSQTCAESTSTIRVKFYCPIMNSHVLFLFSSLLMVQFPRALLHALADKSSSQAVFHSMSVTKRAWVMILDLEDATHTIIF
jgi:hypothetical protein